MRTGNLPVVGAVLVLAYAASAATQQDFEESYQAYRDAVAAQQVGPALEHAAEARRLGEELFADNPSRIAVLVFNQGVALAKARRGEEAFPVLTEARTLVAEAFGEDAEQVMQIDIALLDSVPRSRAARYYRRTLKDALTRHAEDSEFIADLKLHGAVRMWDKDTVRTLGQAAETYRATGNRRSYGIAQMWMGRKLFRAKDYRRAVAPFTQVIDTFAADDPYVLTARAHLVEAFEKLGESDRATEHCVAIGRTRPWSGTADYQPLFKKGPTYPQSALRNSEEGFVLLAMTVDEMGFVRNPEVVDSKGGAIFHEPALEAVKEFRYAPKFVDGEPVEVTGVLNRIIFEMR